MQWIYLHWGRMVSQASLTIEPEVAGTRLLTPSERQLVAATARVGIVGALPGTAQAWERDQRIEPALAQSARLGGYDGRRMAFGDAMARLMQLTGLRFRTSKVSEGPTRGD